MYERSRIDNPQTISLIALSPPLTLVLAAVKEFIAPVNFPIKNGHIVKGDHDT